MAGDRGDLAGALERGRTRFLDDCVRATFTIGDPDLVRAFVGTVLDNVLAGLRGEPGSPPGPEGFKVHPEDSFQIAVRLFDVISPTVLEVLVSSGASAERSADVLAGIHADLVNRAMAMSSLYIDYLRVRAETADRDERFRIARDLEGRLVPGLWDALADLERFERDADPAGLQASIEGLAGTLETIRDVNVELRRRLSGASLEAALRENTPVLGAGGVEARLSVTGDESLLSQDIRDMLLMTLSEAAGALVRYGRTSAVELQVRVGPREVRCLLGGSVAWGDASSATPLGLAVVSLRERLELLGGQMVWEPRADGGNQVRLTVPLPYATKAPSAARH
ncbi:hypothetical protein [Actinocorallia longicatena]|uniref:Histidine kinase n=1 Tax=Actinocorallia longicatena TaxID=111803 RepID=A0ABP6PXN9_9ACTN